MSASRGSRIIGLGALVAAACAGPAAAQEDFYKGKTITIVTSTGPGGVYDLVARLTARHMGKYLVGAPNLVVNNMPGAGNMLAANYMYEIAPKDGTSIAVFNNAVPLNQVLDGRGVRFDASKFNWLGSTGGRNEAVFAFRTAGVLTLEDLRSRELVVGSTGPGSSIAIYPTVMNNMLGAKFRIVNGYKSSTEVFLAMERGEINARSGSLASISAGFQRWLDEKRLVFFAQVGSRRDKDIPDVPLLTELARNDDERRVLALISAPAELGQPYLAPPGVSSARVLQLREAFAKSLRDADFMGDAEKAQVDLDPISGEDIAKIVHDVVHAPEHVVAAARNALK
jgi:tripartite-type tricarboxylate transporter receptor subunit TctC